MRNATVFCFHRRSILFSVIVLITGCQWPLPSSEHIVSISGDSRIVYITDSKARGNTITCVEPSRKSDDSFKDFTETVLKTASQYHNPETVVERAEEVADEAKSPRLSYTQSSTVTGTFENRRNKRIHNMRELLFEICQARANGLVDNISYEKLLIRIIDRTASMHALEVLLHELDSRPLDKSTRSQLIHLTAQILDVNLPIGPHDGERD